MGLILLQLCNLVSVLIFSIKSVHYLSKVFDATRLVHPWEHGFALGNRKHRLISAQSDTVSQPGSLTSNPENFTIPLHTGQTAVAGAITVQHLYRPRTPTSSGSEALFPIRRAIPECTNSPSPLTTEYLGIDGWLAMTPIASINQWLTNLQVATRNQDSSNQFLFIVDFCNLHILCSQVPPKWTLRPRPRRQSASCTLLYLVPNFESF